MFCRARGGVFVCCGWVFPVDFGCRKDDEAFYHSGCKKDPPALYSKSFAIRGKNTPALAKNLPGNFSKLPDRFHRETPFIP